MKSCFFTLVLGFAAFAASEKVRWRYFHQEHFPDKEITAIAYDSLQNYWFGTREGLVRMSPSEQWETYTRENTSGGLGGNWIRGLGVDEDGDLWVATDGGLSEYSGGTWEPYTVKSTRNGLPGDSVLCLHIDPKNRVWVGTTRGFAVLEQSVWTTYSKDRIAGLIPDPKIYAIQPETLERVWLGTVSGVYFFNGSSYKLYNQQNTKEGLPNNYITRLEKDSKGVLWVGTQDGLASFDGKTWTNYNKNADVKLPGDMVYDLVVRETQVWVGLRGGAAWKGDKGWKIYTKDNTDFGLPSRRVLSIQPGEEGSIWFGTREGLSRMAPIP